MKSASQFRLCRASIIIGVLFCVVAVLEVSIGLMGVFSQLGGLEEDTLKYPGGVAQAAGEAIITVIVRLWPLPLGVLFLAAGLLWRRRLRRRQRALP